MGARTIRPPEAALTAQDNRRAPKKSMLDQPAEPDLHATPRGGNWNRKPSSAMTIWWRRPRGIPQFGSRTYKRAEGPKRCKRAARAVKPN